MSALTTQTPHPSLSTPSAIRTRPDSASSQTPALTPFPDLTQPEVAFPLYPHPEIDPRLVTHLDNVYLQNLDMPELIEKARVAVIGHATALLKAEPQRNVDYVVLDLPCTFFMLRSLRWGLSLGGVGSLRRSVLLAGSNPCSCSCWGAEASALWQTVCLECSSALHVPM